MDPLTIIALVMLTAAIVSTPPLMAWCMRDLTRRQLERDPDGRG